jgi:hypothetical protein
MLCSDPKSAIRPLVLNLLRICLHSARNEFPDLFHVQAMAYLGGEYELAEPSYLPTMQARNASSGDRRANFWQSWSGRIPMP